MTDVELVIAQTKKWLKDVVIGCNFCPFANAELKNNTIFYRVVNSADKENALHIFLQECKRLDDDVSINTVLVIFPDSYENFDGYLDLVEDAESLLKKYGYEGIYQVASFHPEYVFGDGAFDDAANFTNRSVYPMLHLLREEQIENALERYPHPENIPANNIAFARNKGTVYMKMLRDLCL